MSTELKIVDRQPQPGRQINVVKCAIRNCHLHQVLEPISQLMLGIIESDSNNSMAQSSARETRNIWLGWGLVKNEWTNAKAFRDGVRGKLEKEFYVLLPDGNEVQMVCNVKIKRVLQALDNLAFTLAGIDSSTMQKWVGPAEIIDIDELIAQTETILTQYLGDGLGDVVEGFNTGLNAPIYPTDTLKPSVDLGATELYEPSSERPGHGSIKDVPDLPSQAPLPGETQPSS